MNIVRPEVEDYMRELNVIDDEPVLLEMEALAEERSFPIIGRLCGRTLEVLARSINATRIFELGSGYGFSAYWFARATGSDGEIHLTDMDPENEKLALEFLGRAGLAEPIRYHVGDALASFGEVDGEFDIVYCDIDKHGYPDAWRAARERVRVGGYFICDNVLWSSRVAAPAAEHDEWTKAIDAMNRLIAADPAYRSTIIPTRDGVVAALRVE